MNRVSSNLSLSSLLRQADITLPFLVHPSQTFIVPPCLCFPRLCGYRTPPTPPPPICGSPIAFSSTNIALCLVPRPPHLPVPLRAPSTPSEPPSTDPRLRLPCGLPVNSISSHSLPLVDACQHCPVNRIWRSPLVYSPSVNFAASMHLFTVTTITIACPPRQTPHQLPHSLCTVNLPAPSPSTSPRSATPSPPLTVSSSQLYRQNAIRYRAFDSRDGELTQQEPNPKRVFWNKRQRRDRGSTRNSKNLKHHFLLPNARLWQARCFLPSVLLLLDRASLVYV